MSRATPLEREYRRWMRCYPRSYRQEHEAEILTVLVAAGEGRCRPDLDECWALLAGGMRARLWSRVPRTNRPLLVAVRLMLVGAAVELIVGITIVATMGRIRAAIVATDPGYTGAQWHAEVAGALDPLVVGAAIATGFWLLMAWAAGRGHSWARVAFVAFLALTSLSLVNGLLHGSAVYARADLAAGSVLWLITFTTAVLLYLREFRRLTGRLAARFTGGGGTSSQ